VVLRSSICYKERLLITREQYATKLKARVDQWNAEVAKWEAKSRSAQADMRTEYERQLDAFRRPRDHALEHMHKVQAATGDA